MARVGAKHGNAVFKLITRGGTKDRGGLAGQMKYIFNDEKVARVIDPSGRLDPYGQVETRDINRITLDWSSNWWANTRNGNTSHMIFSYPEETSIDDVEGITRAVCHEMFESGDRRFSYVGAIHTDQANPHAHIILNRRADDNTLLHMRSGTEHSYEGMREAMASHAARRGIELDPTFRFERGIRAAQPDRNEQILAGKERRPPQQKAHRVNGLVYIEDQISNARIMYQSMAVIAANADCPRLENAYSSLAEIVETAEGKFDMPALERDELERFDQYTGLLNETIARAEKALETKDAAKRVRYEIKLDGIVKEFTSLSPDADYARDHHMRAESSSIYMHEPGAKIEAVRSLEVQAILKDIEREYGVSAEALTERLQHEGTTQSLEQTWIKSDFSDVYNHTDPRDFEELQYRTEEMHQVLREELVERDVLRVIPHLEDDYEWEPERSEAYVFTPDRLQRDVAATIQHYKEGGAPDEWIRENAADIRHSVEERYDAQTRAAAVAHAELMAPLTAARETSPDGSNALNREAGLKLVEELKARNLFDPSLEKMQVEIGRDMAERYPDMPHHVVDRLATGYSGVALISTALEDRARPGAGRDPFAQYQNRRTDDYTLTPNADEHRALMKIVHENTTPEEYQRLVAGDHRGLDRLVSDPTLQRQILTEVETYERGQGTLFSREVEDRLRDNREHLAEEFDRGRDRDNGYER